MLYEFFILIQVQKTFLDDILKYIIFLSDKVRKIHLKQQFLFENHEDNFDERCHLNSSFRIVYLK
jgi:hypothetical protein